MHTFDTDAYAYALVAVGALVSCFARQGYNKLSGATPCCQHTGACKHMDLRKRCCCWADMHKCVLAATDTKQHPATADFSAPTVATSPGMHTASSLPPPCHNRHHPPRHHPLKLPFSLPPNFQSRTIVSVCPTVVLLLG